MVELRKRKAPSQPPSQQPPATEKKSRKSQAPAKQSDNQGSGEADSVDRALNVGDTVSLEGFGGEIQANDGTKTTLKKLVDESDSGVVLFTYPKASTPGCKFNCAFLLFPIFQFLSRMFSIAPAMFLLGSRPQVPSKRAYSGTTTTS
jgi:peroxiredoxin Q/BCP